MGKIKRLEPQALFCWYYLGVNPEGGYGFVNANQLARTLNWTTAELMEALRQGKMHPDQVLHTDFPLAHYQVQLQLAAEKESSRGLLTQAQQAYAGWHARRGKKRDWLDEIEREREEDRLRSKKQHNG